MRVLRGREQRVGLVDRIVLGQCRARLPRVRDQPVVANLQFDDRRGRVQCGLCRRLVAELEIEIHVAGNVLVDLLAGPGGGEINDRCQHLIVDFHQLGGIHCLLEAFGNHRDDMVTDVADLAVGEDRVRRLVGWRSVAVGHNPATDRPADPVGSDMLAGEDGDDAVGLFGRCGADRLDVGVRVDRANKMNMELSRPADIGRVTAGSGQEPLVFLAPNRGADTVFDASFRHA